MISTLSKFNIITSAGECKLVKFEEFLYNVKREQTYSDQEIKVAKPSENLAAAVPIKLSTEVPIKCSYSTEVLKTKPFYNYLHEDSYISETKLTDSIIEFLRKEFIQLLAKKSPAFSVDKGELSFDTVQQMADIYAEEFGGDPMMGFEIQLNKYQKFFIIACPTDFTFFYTDYKDHNEFRGALHTFYEKRWVLVPFKDSIIEQQAHTFNTPFKW